MKDKTKRVLGTMDAIGMYVNVQPENAAKEVMNEILETVYTIRANKS